MTKPAVLVVKLGAIGDVVLSLPAIHALRTRHPGASISLLIGQAAAPLLNGDPAIDDLWVIDENDFWKKRIVPLVRLFLAIQRRHFQRVYILHWSPVFHLFFWLAGIPERIGFAREGRSFHLTRGVPYYEGHAAHHDVDLYLQLIQDMPFPASSTPRLVLQDAERQQAEHVWQSLGAHAGQQRIVIAPGGGHNAKLQMPMKRWPADHFVALIRRLRETGACVALVGSEPERELLGTMGLPEAHNLAGTFGLRTTAALIATAQLFVGNDSGLTHVAAAVGTPSLVFFGPTSPHGKQARGTPQRILYRQEACSPCYRFGVAPPCPYGLKCLANITPEEAFQTCKALVA